MPHPLTQKTKQDPGLLTKLALKLKILRVTEGMHRRLVDIYFVDLHSVVAHFVGPLTWSHVVIALLRNVVYRDYKATAELAPSSSQREQKNWGLPE